MKNILNNGRLRCSGRSWQLVESDKSCIPGGKKNGDHLIILFSDKNRYCSREELGELYVTAEQLATEYAHQINLYRIVKNGKGLQFRKGFHLHLILPKKRNFIARCVEPSVSMIKLRKWQGEKVFKYVLNKLLTRGQQQKR